MVLHTGGPRSSQHISEHPMGQIYENYLKEKLSLLPLATNRSAAFIFQEQNGKWKLSRDWLLWTKKDSSERDLSIATDHSTAFTFQEHYAQRKLCGHWLLWATKIIFAVLTENECCMQRSFSVYFSVITTANARETRRKLTEPIIVNGFCSFPPAHSNQSQHCFYFVCS